MQEVPQMPRANQSCSQCTTAAANRKADEEAQRYGTPGTTMASGAPKPELS